MPIYEFFCKKCEQTYEQQKKVDDFDSNCPLCGEKAKKIMSAASFNVKGSTNRSVDSVVGEDAANRWQRIEENQKARQKQQYGSIDRTELKVKESQRISNVLNKQNQAYSTIEKAKQDAGITKRDELNHAIGGDK